MFGRTDIVGLRSFVATGQKQDHRSALFAKVETVSRSEIQARFPDTASDGFMVAEIAVLESQHSRLNARLHADVETLQPSTEGTFPLRY